LSVTYWSSRNDLRSIRSSQLVRDPTLKTMHHSQSFMFRVASKTFEKVRAVALHPRPISHHLLFDLPRLQRLHKVLIIR
jgi:hypothetical protein